MLRTARRRLKLGPRLPMVLLLCACVAVYLLADMFDSDLNASPRQMRTTSMKLATDHDTETLFYRYLRSLTDPQSGDKTITEMVEVSESYFVRERIMMPPPDKRVPLNLSVPWPIEASKLGWPSRIIEILHFKTGGFFVEFNANDGETFSNTLMLERQFGWTGLLMQSNPHKFQSLVYKRRQVHLSNTCLSYKTEPEPDLEEAKRSTAGGEQREKYRAARVFELHTLLQYMDRGQTPIDYLSLDIEGGEMEVLKAIAWDKVNIRTLTVRVDNDDETKSLMRSYMKDRGYYVHEYMEVNDADASLLFVAANLDTA